MTIHEKLQEFLNECIKRGWIPMGINKCNVIMKSNKGIALMERLENQQDFIATISYHDLFSEDSGIMEFVDWEQDEHIEKIIIQEHGGFKYDLEWSPYYAMADMTAEQKIEFFNTHAKLPK